MFLLFALAFLCSLTHACPAGFYEIIDDDHSVCKPCPVGSKSPFVNARTCTSCPPHTYQDQVGQVACKHCPRGYAQPQPKKSYCSHPQHILQSTSHTLAKANEQYCVQDGGPPTYNFTARICDDGINNDTTPCQCTSCNNIEVFMIQPGQYCENGLYFNPTFVPTYMYGAVRVQGETQCVDRCARWSGILRENFDENTVTLLNSTEHHSICNLVSHHIPLRSNKCI